MRSYEDLVAEADAADVAGWGFSFLDGRASEERPPWGYARLQARALAQADSALDIDTGGGEVLDEAPRLPRTMHATESWPPNLAQARARLGPRGVRVLAAEGGRLPLPDRSVDLVTSRHPVAPDFPEIHRVLRPGGRYLAQHVGPASAFELIEAILGPLPPEHRLGRDPDLEMREARAAGLVIDELRRARCRMEFTDIGAVVWILRTCVWWVPDFDSGHCEPELRALDAGMRAGRPFVAHSTRHLVLARRPEDDGEA